MAKKPKLPTRFDEQFWYSGPGSDDVCSVVKYYQGYYGIYRTGAISKIGEYKSGDAATIRKYLDYFMKHGEWLE